MGNRLQDDEERVQLKQQCIDLLFDCPGGNTDAGCPFARIRGLQLMDRVKWLKRQTLQHLKDLVDHHRQCRSGQCKERA